MLLGSFGEDDPEVWQQGFEAYQSVRQLLPAEFKAIALFDQSGVLLSGISWLRWIDQEKRDFEAERPRIMERIQGILRRLERLS